MVNVQLSIVMMRTKPVSIHPANNTGRDVAVAHTTLSKASRKKHHR